MGQIAQIHFFFTQRQKIRYGIISKRFSQAIVKNKASIKTTKFIKIMT